MRSSASSLPLPPPPVSTSTALSANPSPASTVPTPRTRASPNAATSANADDDDATPPPLPELRTYVATADDDRVAGLKLVADSIAQQRQLASRALLAHPAHLALYVAVLAAIAQYLYRRASDLPLVMTTWAGVTMAALAGVRWAAGGYIFLAEEVNWEWLGEDTMVVVRWGEEVIGALVLGWADEVGGGRRGKGRGKKCRRGVVRAWTVRLKYRGKGVGEGLLEEAVKVCMERGAEGVEFAEDHASELTPFFLFGRGFVALFVFWSLVWERGL
jgi:GNAT superfamily N-acetyltransferase